ncbi:MAG TPA: hypothetical protein VIL20_08210, partial [Sandaracinaceae bacterium]
MANGDDLEETARFRPNLKPLLVALVANLAFGGVFLGWPYLRGLERTERSALAFARFAACLFDAEVAERPGITLPRGERARFATLFVRGEDGWPGRCRDELARITPEPSHLLFPSVKNGEHRVREEIARLDRALAAMDRAGPRVPSAPLERLARVQAALAEQLRTVGVDFDPRRDAIVLASAREGEGDLPTPSIVPTQAGADRWWVALEGGAVVASGIDGRTVAHVRVEAGRVELRRARRPRLSSAVLGAREPPLVLWTTPEARCGGDCAQRATGIARFVEDRQRLLPEAWLRAHPAANAPDDAVLAASGGVWMAARADGGLALRRFAWPGEDGGERAPGGEDGGAPGRTDPDGASSAGPAQHAAELERTVEVSGLEAVHWLDGAPPLLVWVGASAGALLASEDAAPIPLERPAGRVRIASDGRAEDGWIALAGERAVHVVRAGRADASVLDVAPRPPGRGAVRVVCASHEGCGAADVLVLRDRALHRARCTPE